MGRRWRQGECPLTEEYLALHPELRAHPEAALELVYEEVCLSREHGRTVSEEDLASRFPQWREKLAILFDFHRLLEPAPAFPIAGATLGDFRLLAELGRGAQGRVFLATQPGLADRPVVLKLTPCRGQEHLSLARLQHTHIVPLYSAHVFADRNLRALCMPYFGGATLADVLEALRQIPPRQRSGQHLVMALGNAQAAAPLPSTVAGPACEFLAGASYAQAICWLGACLADALQYAREHGLVHLDLKPSNVLLAADGLPLLLDFHLARAPLAAGAAASQWLGGTPAYMAPEHRAALAAVREGRNIPFGVDERADVYALGLLLYEALGGPMPPASAAPARGLRRHNPQVSVGLADILDRCLAAGPAQRYAGAAALAADLRRHLDNQPLHGVANRSWTERWHKWRRRRPYGIAALCLALALAGAGAVIWSHFAKQVRQVEAALPEGTAHLHAQRYREAVGVFKHGLAMAEDLPFELEVARRLREQLHWAERGQAIQELHAFVERIRALYGDSLPAGPAARAIEAHCRQFWDQRDLIVRRLAVPDTAQMNEQTRQDLLDLAILWTNLRVRLAGTEAAAARREALEVLEQAETLFGPSSVLYHERRAQAAALGLADAARTAAAQAAALAPRTAWEHYAVGRALLRDGDLPRATEHFEHALALQPQALWPNFAKGKCAYQQGQYEDAIVAFTACVVLAPESAWCYANRGLAYAALGRPHRALHDYDQALRLDPNLAVAARNRGLLHLQERRFALARADLQRAMEHGANPADVRYHLALVHLAEDDRAAALASVRQALQHDPAHKEARALEERLRLEP
jgi:serine/threonine protein kinase/Flp pilus assembly protein TadD